MLDDFIADGQDVHVLILLDLVVRLLGQLRLKQ
jgi:hypothetical protein